LAGSILLPREASRAIAESAGTGAQQLPPARLPSRRVLPDGQTDTDRLIGDYSSEQAGGSCRGSNSAGAFRSTFRSKLIAFCSGVFAMGRLRLTQTRDPPRKRHSAMIDIDPSAAEERPLTLTEVARVVQLHPRWSWSMCGAGNSLVSRSVGAGGSVRGTSTTSLSRCRTGRLRFSNEELVVVGPSGRLEHPVRSLGIPPRGHHNPAYFEVIGLQIAADRCTGCNPGATTWIVLRSVWRQDGDERTPCSRG